MFTGLSAFPITPASPDGTVDTKAVARLTERLVTAGAPSVGLLGSTGTYAYLSAQERSRAIAAAQEVTQGRTPLLVGTGALRTDTAIALTQDAARHGADAALIAPVSYTPLTQEEAFQHYSAIANATDLPLVIYNNPGTTHFTFSRDLIARLAENPAIQAIKMPLPTGDLSQEINDLRRVLPEDFSLGYSGDWGSAAALKAGADAWYSVVGGILPSETLALAQAAKADAPDWSALDTRFGPLWTLFKTHGSLRIVYAIANLQGLTTAQPPRPIFPVDKSVLPEIEAALAALQ